MASPSVICFLPYTNDEQSKKNIKAFKHHNYIQKIVLLTTKDQERGDFDGNEFNGIDFLEIDGLYASHTMRAIAQRAASFDGDLLLYSSTLSIELKEDAIKKMVRSLQSDKHAFVYSDYNQRSGEQIAPLPVISYQQGSLRNDFDFGSLILFKQQPFIQFAQQIPDFHYAGLYALTLQLAHMESSSPARLKEFLYTVEACDTRRSDEKQFDYVDPRNREVQIEMEDACTYFMKSNQCYLEPGLYEDLSGMYEKHPVTGVSVIIPVRNRARTIADAIRSALFQELNVPYNILIVDNHSTDGTTEIIADCASRDSRIVHIIPESHDLGIGGCWNLAVNHKECKTLAVQLDSDDLYSDEKTLQKVADVFKRRQCAMVIGSYRMTDFNLNTIPPGVIDHKEWTEENGRNNGLRINGFGAPRAFYVPLLRKFKFPNSNYGEDYAMVLAMTRRYPIERIFDVLYLCRRWEGNSDAALSVEKVNANNLYKDKIRTLELKNRRNYLHSLVRPNEQDLQVHSQYQLECWELARKNHQALKDVRVRHLENSLALQYNPGRIASTKPVTDIRTTKTHSCILCASQRPKEQLQMFDHTGMSCGIAENRSEKKVGPFEMLLNPFPIFPGHYTIVHEKHRNQDFFECMKWLVQEAISLPNYTFIYNGPQCGASVPDHAHFQCFQSTSLPIMSWVEERIKSTEAVCFPSDQVKVYALTDTLYPIWVVTESQRMHLADLFRALRTVVRSLPKVKGEKEPRFNLLVWTNKDGERRYTIVPRRKHRPDCFYADGAAQLKVSPGAIDMGGYIITPREEDFDRLNEVNAAEILKEVAITKEEMQQSIERWNQLMNE